MASTSFQSAQSSPGIAWPSWHGISIGSRIDSQTPTHMGRQPVRRGQHTYHASFGHQRSGERKKAGQQCHGNVAQRPSDEASTRIMSPSDISAPGREKRRPATSWLRSATQQAGYVLESYLVTAQ